MLRNSWASLVRVLTIIFTEKYTAEALNHIINIALNRTKLPKLGIEVEIIDLETKLITTCEFTRKAAKAINYDIKSLPRRIKKISFRKLY